MVARAEHVWVSDVQVWGDRRAPGLLLGWRRTDERWEGWVIVVHLGSPAGGGGGPYVRQGWVRAESIQRRQ